MWTLPDEIKKETLIGLELKTLEPAHVIYQKKNRNVYWLTVYIANGAGYTHVHTGDKAGFIDFVLPLLNRLQVRLFHPKDAIALSNWGLVNQ